MNSREMLLSLIDRYILEEADRRKQYNDNQVMIDLYEEVLKILKGDYQEIKDNSLCISILFDTIYHNDIYYEEFYSLLLRSIVDNTQRREFKKFVWKISNEMLELEKANEELKKQIHNGRSVIIAMNSFRLIPALTSTFEFSLRTRNALHINTSPHTHLSTNSLALAKW